MIQKKICMLGAFSVGKTSLVSRFVKGIFSEQYLTTIGVKIDQKTVRIDNRRCQFILWDLAGEDPFQQIQHAYIYGSAGYILVADGTRPATVSKAMEIQEKVAASFGNLPFVFVLNKVDLVNEWAVDPEEIKALAAKDWTIVTTSANTGIGVPVVFKTLAKAVLTPEASDRHL